ncbi:site-specific integrase [Pleionea litopenaei]|uniref:Site-specific integrase n=1 Tax=Pleionea litopenaei TaxID=3070815 RepID=A0AA51X770_9GAMM|nr:site-specific integrase [Pleionea sp. HL-JVS1]WMS87893.1 site-specific integrase [Pleionea sp. HL-JVS1]
MRQLQLLDKQDSILNEDQVLFIKGLSVPARLHLIRADRYDDKQIDTSGEKWVYYFSGYTESINFERLPSPLRNLVKYSFYLYCQVNSPTKLSTQFSSIYSYLSGVKKGEFNYKCLSKKLKSIENSTSFYCCINFLKTLCKLELPGFKETDLDSLLLVPRPKDDKWLVYQNVDLILDEPVKNMIVQGLWEVASKLDKSIRISTQELKYCSILGLCYTTGARPVQISKLSCSDLVRDTKGDNNKPARFSLKLPYAKQQKLRPERILISLPYELSKIILAYVRQSYLSGEDKLFELGAQSVQQIRYAINKQMLSFASEDFQEKVKNGDAIQPIYTSTDFRHNVGHSLAMQGVSASEIAHILGHSSLVAAKHYILSTPELAQIRSKVLGTNSAYQQMIAMMLTGAITTSKSWDKKKVAGFIGDKLHSHIGGCSYKDDCPFSQVRSCYSCLYFHPFNDGNHNDVLKSVESELGELIELSDSVGNSKNPVINIQSNTHNEVRSVLTRCRLYNGE